MKKGIFITATGTDIGKTYISALIVSSLRLRGINAGYYKPILSGAVKRGEMLIPEDCKYVNDFANLNSPLENLVTYVFDEPLSPHLAAARANREINIDAISADFEKACQRFDYVVVEGCGGLACPIYECADNVIMLKEIIKITDFEMAIVIKSGLGSLNSAVLTASYANNNGLKTKGIIMNKYERQNFLHIDNKRMVTKLTGLPVLACVENSANSITWEI